jgi:hypothetical protein
MITKKEPVLVQDSHVFTKTISWQENSKTDHQASIKSSEDAKNLSI